MANKEMAKLAASLLAEQEAKQVYEVEFDGDVTCSLAALESEGFFGEDGHDLTREEVAGMAVGRSLNFAGGAAPLGTITRLS